MFSIEHESLFARTGDLTFRVESSEEIFVLHEILVRRIYAYVSHGPTLVLDIGMNVGVFSIVSASQHDVEVWGFEPFEPTLAAAEHNLRLNPHVRERVRTHSYGLGGSDADHRWEYVPTVRASCGVFGVPVGVDRTTVQTLPVRLRRASAVVDEARATAPDRRLVAKIDCEGGEYAIMRDLVESRRIELIDSIMMEWHRRDGYDPSWLFDCLHRSGFAVYSSNDGGSRDGLCVAVQQRPDRS